MTFDTMQLHLESSIATVILNRPAVLNCINSQWLDDFRQIVDVLADQTTPRVVIIRGAGRAFCSGIDLDALATDRIPRSFFRAWEVELRRIETLNKVVIAAIHSYCLGGGLQLALACDIRVATADARFGLTATTEGILPGMGMWRLARYAGCGRAKLMCLTAQTIDADLAERWGIVDLVVAPDRLDAEVARVTTELLSMPHASSTLIKRLITVGAELSHSDCLEVFDSFQESAVASAEHLTVMGERRRRRKL